MIFVPRSCDRLAVDRRQVDRIVARPGYLVAADESPDPFQVSRREFKRGGREVFLQVLPTLGARNGNDVIPLCSSQASATWPGVADFSSANWRTSAARFMFSSKFFP
jgi:hypothetical protein